MAHKVLLLGVDMWKDVMAPEHVPIYLDRVVSQHVSSLKQEWISPQKHISLIPGAERYYIHAPNTYNAHV